MAAPKSSRLDMNQCIQGAYDDETGRLRTDSVATVVNADIDVALDPSEDGVYIADKDSGNKLKVESSGSININKVSGTVSLPTGAATSALQTTGNNTLNSINTKTPALVSGRVPVDGSGVTQPISAVSLPLPVGAATDSTLINQTNSIVSTLNSTTTLLGSNQTFTGGWEDCSQFSSVGITLISSSNSVNNGLKLQFSHNSTDILREIDSTYISSANGTYFSLPIEAKYYRIIFQNGPIAQTKMVIETLLSRHPNGLSTIPVITPLTDETSLLVTRSVITGKNPDGDFENERVSGVVSSNSSTTPLGVGGVFQGPYFDSSIFSANSYTCLTDQAGTIDIETSDDQTTVIRVTTYNVPPNQTFYISQTPVGRYIRVRFVNTSGVAQTFFRLQVLQKTTPISPTALTISEPLNNNSIALNSRSIIAGQRENGTFGNVGLSNSASIKVAITDRPSEVRNRVKVEARIFNTSITTTPTVIYTVTPGKTLYVESMIISALNSSNTVGEYRITNGETDKLGYLLPDKVIGGPSVSSATSPALPEPIPFTTNIGVRKVLGDISISVFIIGYEE